MTYSQRSAFTTWDGTAIAYHILGNKDSKKDIVLVNGLFCTESYWKFLIEELSPDYRIITWDYRGHQFSDSPVNRENVQIDSSAKDIHSLLDYLNIKKPVLIGFSLGVQVVFEFFKLFPDRIKAIVAVTGPFENPMATFYGLPVPDAVWEAIFGTLANRIPGITNTLWHSAFKLPIVHTVATLSGSTKASAELMQGFYDHQKIVDVPNGLRMALGAIKHSARDVLPKINVPTLVIGGEKDTYTPVSLSYTMRDTIPGVDFIMIEKGTHTTLIEKPDLVNRAVSEFLSKKVYK